VDVHGTPYGRFCRFLVFPKPGNRLSTYVIAVHTRGVRESYLPVFHVPACPSRKLAIVAAIFGFPSTQLQILVCPSAILSCLHTHLRPRLLTYLSG
jgi:hypothetical protein